MVTATRGRPRAFDRDEALDRAIRLFWTRGYEATSVRDLSEELGIGQPSLYNAFGGKRALFDEAVAAYDRDYGGFIDAAIVEEPTASLAMRRILTEAPARYTRRGLPRGCLVTTGDAGTTDTDVRDAMARLREAKRAQLKTKIDADIKAGQLPDEIDSPTLSAYVMATLAGLVQRARDGASRRELDGIAGIAASALP
ncbi:TetR family transcriptional regulator [Micromonospora qiuiae]|uniref:TetR family transcriptional regulator n=1 Tax=Micromonospora qiuiae TaxID=502268 RepID=A0ABQ4J6M2_9ACTN|nr:TetR/AcrR family transcriptional regulator [Micromonospora qiuiae]GIJ25829.1 TetR family transcriptional regulator [Micromonospora qiuiae]